MAYEWHGLKHIWRWETGMGRGHEAASLVAKPAFRAGKYAEK